MWGPPATSNLNQGPNQDFHSEQGGGGLRTWVSKAQDHHVQSSWELGAPFNKTSKHPRGVGEVCPDPEPPPPSALMGCAVHRDTGSRWG